MRIAEGITISGQLSIRWIANKLNELFNKILKTENVDRIVLIDTDSVVLTLEDLIEKVCPQKGTEDKIKYMDKVAENIIQPFLDKSYEELADYMNAYEQRMQMKRENLVDTMISVSKKRYVMSVYNSEGVQYKEPQLKIMGLQVVKSSTPAVIRDKLKESLHTILRGTEADVQNYVDGFRAEFATLSAEEIAFPRSISDVLKYMADSTIYKKATPIHVRGALMYNHLVKTNKLTKVHPPIRNGDNIKFIYLKTPNPIGEDCISFVDKLPKEFKLTPYVDYDKMFEKTFQDAIQNTLDSLGWSSQRTATLDDFFV
jgi:DNA polymerase elongation subunit (family B)